ncbi:hypothetical protein WICPIJ_002189 [Wickerhamomyces pijperi]|uniref:Uncharacterized protein n=1 Tax=Wickerhamomyces pijperi TaxID=599730 RepID=A0A9P8Q9F3_WICPI|nr:hypothetical protein WICPIJ_002189 [Wickerhamomyces pijperi]
MTKVLESPTLAKFEAIFKPSTTLTPDLSNGLVKEAWLAKGLTPKDNTAPNPLERRLGELRELLWVILPWELTTVDDNTSDSGPVTANPLGG